MAAVRLAGAPDRTARARTIERYLPLVRGIARRFAGCGEPLEDLVQVGNVALIRAVDRCGRGREAQLTAYAATCVEGEIRRHLRDRCAPLRIPRRVQGDAALVATLRAPATLDESTVAEAIPAPGALDDVGLARALVAAAARALDAREREVVALRYFLDLSQAEIGDEVGLSQVHVGRVLRRALGKMRVSLDEAGGATFATGVARLGSERREERDQAVT